MQPFQQSGEAYMGFIPLILILNAIRHEYLGNSIKAFIPLILILICSERPIRYNCGSITTL